MKAWRVDELGHPRVSLRLEEVPDPVPGPGEALVRVGAGTVNFADILLCQGIYQDRPSPPFTPGLETCGVVEAVGPGVDLPVGAHVGGMAGLPSGGFAEKALVRAPAALVMPPSVPFTDATVLYSTYQTSHVALHHRAQLQAGEWLLVHAGAGGVGSAAVQLGAAAGAQVIATAGGPEKVAVCQQLGADHAVDYHVEDVYDRVMEITAGHGVDVVFDPVGGPVTTPSRRLLAWEGRLLVIGFASGDIPSFPGNHVLVKNYTVLGVHWGAYPHHRREVIDIAHEDLMRLYAEGRIRPLVTDVVGLDGVPGALDALEARQVHGRVVLAP
ncbi:MAG: zinc-binding dehydrogenase [Acidimicrobiia bacterium]|nr:zinc-binding dehydrogenase [Acidimicrobiia bacterium]